MKKTLLLLTLALVIGLAWVTQVGQSKSKAYYSGDAVNYQGEVYVVTANTGYVELFKLGERRLELLTRFKPAKEAGMITDDFNDAILNEEGGLLYAYASSGNRLYKYDLSDRANPVLVFKTTDNNWDWYGRLDKSLGRLTTIGSKGVKIWSSDLKVVDSYNVINNSNPYNVRLSADNKFIFNIKGGTLEVFDRQYRHVIRSINLYSVNEKGNRRLAYEDQANMFYVLDDAALKRISLAGDIYKKMEHDSKFGYDVVLSGDQESLYLSNGTSVAKVAKNNFKLLNGFENKDLKQQGAWAMGIERVNSAKGEVLVVFNNTGILALNSRLNVLANFQAGQQGSDKDLVIEPLSLQVDKQLAPVYAEVGLRGAGYWANEELQIDFAGRKYQAKADANGRFFKVVYVPAISETRADIKVVGLRSGLSYSLGFNILQSK